MGLFPTITEALIALVIVLPIGLIGAWGRRFAMRVYRVDVAGWTALASTGLFVLAAATYYWPPPSYLTLNTAVALTLSAGLLAFLSLGAATLGRQGAGVLMGLLYCLLALPLIAIFTFMLFVIVWSGAHMKVPA
jgi:hypothetical protein